MRKEKKIPRSYFGAAIRLLICICAGVSTLYASIYKQNELTELRLALPALAKRVKNLQDENIRLQFEIDRFESPIHLMEIARKPEFSHLKYPYLKDEIFLQGANPLPGES